MLTIQFDCKSTEFPLEGGGGGGIKGERKKITMARNGNGDLPLGPALQGGDFKTVGEIARW